MTKIIDNNPLIGITSHMGMKTLNVILVLFVILLAENVCHASIYGYQDDNGILHFTNIRPMNKKYHTVVYATRQPGDSRGSFQSRSITGREKKDLITFAKTYLGTPYKLGGYMPTGIDCSGFVKQVFSAFDIRLPRTAREQFTIGTRVGKDELSPGDLIFFRGLSGGEPAHVGIFMEEDKFIHATTRNGGGVRVDSLGDNYYKHVFMGASRVVQ